MTIFPREESKKNWDAVKRLFHVHANEEERASLMLISGEFAQLDAENDRLKECNEAMREPMRKLREAVNMPAQGEDAVVDKVLEQLSNLKYDLETEQDEVELKQACIKGMGEQADKLAERIKLLEGVIRVDDERLRKAGESVGIDVGCDTAHWMADEILGLTAKMNGVRQMIERAEHDALCAISGVQHDPSWMNQKQLSEKEREGFGRNAVALLHTAVEMLTEKESKK